MFEWLFSEHYVNMWGAIGVIFDGVATIMAIWAVIYSIASFKKALAVSHYGELDNTYFELLKTALDKPYLYHPETITEQVQQQEYNLYAFMIWNFLEAIYDRAQKDKHLCETWYPIINDEGQRHSNWFKQSENQVKFKLEFIEFVSHKI